MAGKAQVFEQGPHITNTQEQAAHGMAQFESGILIAQGVFGITFEFPDRRLQILADLVEHLPAVGFKRHEFFVGLAQLPDLGFDRVLQFRA
jgi:hypothetical protein